MPRERRAAQPKKPAKRITKARRIALIDGQIKKMQALLKRPQGLPAEEKYNYEHALVVLKSKRKALEARRN